MLIIISAFLVFIVALSIAAAIYTDRVKRIKSSIHLIVVVVLSIVLAPIYYRRLNSTIDMMNELLEAMSVKGLTEKEQSNDGTTDPHATDGTHPDFRTIRDSNSEN